MASDTSLACMRTLASVNASISEPSEEKPGLRAVGRILMAVSLCALLAGCALPGTGPFATPYPEDYVPTAVFLTAASIDLATISAEPPTVTSTATSTATFIPPTAPPTPTPTAGPPVPLAAIQIRAPGAMSRLVSPMQVKMLAVAGDSHIVEVDLLGEDGRLLGRTLSAVAGSADGDPLSLKIPFEIQAAGETGYVQASTKDGRGRVQSLITVPVLLLSSGENQINPPGDTVYERVALVDLPPESTVAGGVLKVEGDMLPYSRQPMILELMTEDGKALSLRVLAVAGKGWQPFSTTLPFNVSQPTSARLFIQESDDVLDGSVYIYSQPLTLEP